MEHQRDDAVPGMSFLAPGFIYEYAEFSCDESLLIRKVPGDTPGHLVEAKASNKFIAWMKPKSNE